MAGVEIPLTIRGLKEAKADLERLDQQFNKFKDDPIKSKKIAKEFNDLSKAIDNTTDELLEMKKAGDLVNETFDDINETLLGVAEGSVLPLSTQIGEMEDRMYQLAAAGETNSTEFKNLQKEAARLRGVIIETDKSVDLMAENKGLSVFATGWAQVGDRIMNLDFEGAAMDAKNLDAAVGNLGSMGAKSIKGLASTVGTLSKTFIKFGVSLLANPIFLIAAVIAGVVAAVVALLDHFGFLEPILDALKAAFDFLVQPIKDAIQAFKDLTDWLGLTSFASDELAQKQIDNAQATQEAIKKQQDEQIASLDKEMRVRQANGEETHELELEKQEIIKQTAFETLKALQQEIKARIQLGDLTEEEVKELKGKLEAQKEIIRNANTEVEVLTAKHNKEVEDKEKASFEKRKQQAEAYAKARLDASRLIQDLELALLDEGIRKELELNRVKFERLREDTLTNESLTNEEKLRINELYERQEFEQRKALKEQAEKDLVLALKPVRDELSAEERAQKLEEEQKLQSQLEAIREDFRLKELEKLEQQKQNRISIAENTLGSINALTEGAFALSDRLGAQDEKSKEARAKRQFKINKALQLAGATMDGFKAVTASLAQSPVAIGAVPNPVGIASLAFAVTTSLANIAKIAATQYQSSGSGGSGTPSGGSPSFSGGSSSVQTSTPDISLFGNSNNFNNLQDEGSAESNQSITVTAVVSETEVTNTQNKIQKINANAEL